MLLKAMMGHVLAYIHVYRGGQSGTRWDTVGQQHSRAGGRVIALEGLGGGYNELEL